MTTSRLYLLICMFLTIQFTYTNKLYAQEGITLEQNPPSVKWRQINTPSFRLIFPRDFETEAQRMANTMQHIYRPVSNSLGVEPAKISILFQNQYSISNGFVTVAPRRSEFFTTPPQDYNFVGTNNWLNLLAVHEFRHVAQYQKSITGFTKYAKAILGGDAWSFIAFIAVPSWYWEGDAVGVETALTKSGRGRIPNFDVGFRTNMLERGPWYYSKQYLGSFKDFVPDFYKVGYHMVTHIKRNYPENALPNALTRTFNIPFIPFRFSSSLKKATGFNVEWTYRNMAAEVDSLWRFQIDHLPITESSKAVYRSNTVFTNYDYPQFLSDGRLVALRTGIANIAQLVLVDSLTSAKKIYTVGQFNDGGMLSVGANKIVWNEFHFNPRWALKTYSVIKVLDVKTKKVKTLTKRSRLSGTAISPDGKKIVAIENATNYQNTIVILDALNGKEIKRISNEAKDFYSMPRWSNDGKFIVVLKVTPQGKTITQITANTYEQKDLLPISSENVGHPVQHNQHLLYNSPYSGIDNIYALDTETGKTFQVTSKEYGTYNPVVSPDGSSMAFNNYSKFGMDVETMPFEPSSWKALEEVEDRNIKYYEPLVKQESNPDILSSIPTEQYKVKKYSQFQGFFNPYSFYLQRDAINRELGGSIHSQNLLSTAVASLGVSFNGNERQPYAFGALSYQGWFPIFDFKFGVGTRSINKGEDLVDIEDSVFSWTEKNMSFGVRLPFNFTRNKYYTQVNLNALAKFSEVSNYPVFNPGTEDNNGYIKSMQYGVSFYRLLKQAHRDVTSRWGFKGIISYENTPFGGDFNTALLATQLKIQMPGFLKHHGFQVRGGYQEIQFDPLKNYVFKTPIFYPRGYAYLGFEKFYNYALEYKLPLWNADWHLGPIINFQRFKAKIFYDQGIGTFADSESKLTSYGLELHADLNILRWLPLIEVGGRVSLSPDFKKPKFEFLLFSFDL